MDTEIIPAPDSQETTLVMSNNHSQGKKPKLENRAKHSDLLDMYVRSDLIDIESSASIDTSGCQALKNALLGNWLNSDQMYNVNKLMLNANYTFNGFQDTMLAPILQKNGRWHIPGDGFTCQKPPPANIHYNSQQHWVTYFQFENGDIYLLDSSLGQKMESCLNDSLKIQLAQIYGRVKSQITVKIPYIQQQKNGYDCRLFAIANLLEFVANRYD